MARPSRGDRKTIVTAVPADRYRTYQTAAERRGWCLSDYLCVVLAEANGLTIPQYIPPPLLPRYADFGDELPLGPELADMGRRTLTIRIPTAHYGAYQRVARLRGETVTEYARSTIAARHGYPDGDLERGTLFSISA